MKTREMLNEGPGIDELAARPNCSQEEAVAVAKKLGDDEAHITDSKDGQQVAHVSPRFVRNWLELCHGDVFAVESPDGEIEKAFKVVSRKTMVPSKIPVVHPTDNRGARNLKNATLLQELETDPAWLWQRYLQGRIVPVDEKVSYHRGDTEEKLTL